MAGVVIRFDSMPGPDGCKFIEVEDAHGNGLSFGEWEQDGDTVVLRLPLEHVWLNAFSCVNPTPEFLQGVGESVVRALMQATLQTHKDAPWRQVFIEVVAS
jgi:hypothetical protein